MARKLLQYINHAKEKLAWLDSDGRWWTRNLETSGQVKSTIPTGTPPVVVDSTTLVTNLNADMLDGVHLADIISGGSGWMKYYDEFAVKTIDEDTKVLLFNFETSVIPDAGDGWTYTDTPIIASINDTYLGTAKALSFADIIDEESTSATYTFTSLTSNTYRIRYSVDSEEGYDYLTITLDDVEILSASGQIPFTDLLFDVTPGNHVLVLTYSKDASADEGADTAYISEIASFDLMTIPVYHLGDVVNHLGIYYICSVEGATASPDLETEWKKLTGLTASEIAYISSEFNDATNVQDAIDNIPSLIANEISSNETIATSSLIAGVRDSNLFITTDATIPFKNSGPFSDGHNYSGGNVYYPAAHTNNLYTQDAAQAEKDLLLMRENYFITHHGELAGHLGTDSLATILPAGSKLYLHYYIKITTESETHPYSIRIDTSAYPSAGILSSTEDVLVDETASQDWTEVSFIYTTTEDHTTDGLSHVYITTDIGTYPIIRMEVKDLYVFILNAADGSPYVCYDWTEPEFIEMMDFTPVQREAIETSLSPIVTYKILREQYTHDGRPITPPIMGAGDGGWDIVDFSRVNKAIEMNLRIDNLLKELLQTTGPAVGDAETDLNTKIDRINNIYYRITGYNGGNVYRAVTLDWLETFRPVTAEPTLLGSLVYDNVAQSDIVESILPPAAQVLENRTFLPNNWEGGLPPSDGIDDGVWFHPVSFVWMEGQSARFTDGVCELFSTEHLEWPWPVGTGGDIQMAQNVVSSTYAGTAVGINNTGHQLFPGTYKFAVKCELSVSGDFNSIQVANVNTINNPTPGQWYTFEGIISSGQLRITGLFDLTEFDHSVYVRNVSMIDIGYSTYDPLYHLTTVGQVDTALLNTVWKSGNVFKKWNETSQAWEEIDSSYFLDVTPPVYTAEDISITDAGNYYTGTNVEAALQEVYAKADAIASVPNVAAPQDMLIGNTNGDAWVTISLSNVKDLVDKHYNHQQISPSQSWVITHNLNKYPAVRVFNGYNEEVLGDIIYDSANQVTINFISPFSGRAFLN